VVAEQYDDLVQRFLLHQADVCVVCQTPMSRIVKAIY
jgi:hypothetical protein